MNNGEQSGNATVREQFAGTEMQVQHETASVAIAAAAKASIEARYILAMRRQRDWDVVRAKMLKECERPGFAEQAIYKKPVGNKFNDDTGKWEKAFVEGLSVRFAEAAIRYVQNFYSSATSIYDDADKSIVRVTVMDLESNATIEIDVHVTKTVERSKLKEGQRSIAQRMNSSGKQVFIVPATDDEVLNKTNALISKALRNGVLRLLPGDIQDECEVKCRETQKKRDAEDPAAAKKRLFDAFAAIGIFPDQLKEYLGHANELQVAELGELRAIYSAIKDGETTWAAIVDAKTPTSSDAPKNEANQKVDELLEKHKAKAAAKAAAKAKGKDTAGSADGPDTKTETKTETKPDTAPADIPKNEPPPAQNTDAKSSTREPGED